MKNVVVVTGIGDGISHLERATRHWPEQFGLRPIVHAFGWEGEASEVDQRLDTLRQRQTELKAAALIGISAGASASAIIAAENPQLIFINVCGRLHQAGNAIYKYQKYRTRAPIFVETVGRAETALGRLNADRCLIFRAVYDELVPSAATVIEGVDVITVPIPTHILGIYYALRWQGHKIAALIS